LDLLLEVAIFLAKPLYPCFCGHQNVRFRHGVLRPLIRLTSGRLVGHWCSTCLMLRITSAGRRQKKVSSRV